MKKGLFIPDTLTERKKFLNSYLSQFVGKKFFCKALNVDVYFNSNSLKETVYKAAISKKSTELVYYMPYIIANMKPYKKNAKPKSKSQKTNFFFENIMLLTCEVKNVGIAHIVIGMTINKNYVEYSITDFEYKKKRQ